MHTIKASKYLEERIGKSTPVQIDFIDHLRKNSGTRFFIAGGSIRSLFTDSPENFTDIDVFPIDEENYNILNEYLSKEYGEDKKRENDLNTRYEIVFKREIRNGATDEELIDETELVIQNIKFFYSTPHELIDSFDFTICQFSYNHNEDIFIIGENSVMDLLNKKLVIHKISYPLSTFRRFFKYTKKGFYACKGCLETFMHEIRHNNELDIGDEIEYID